MGYCLRWWLKDEYYNALKDLTGQLRDLAVYLFVCIKLVLVV